MAILEPAQTAATGVPDICEPTSLVLLKPPAGGMLRAVFLSLRDAAIECGIISSHDMDKIDCHLSQGESSGFARWSYLVAIWKRKLG